jgi:uncharacterized protein YutE (UPF0331/DUF86 family)/predicted nucleotidyltransferase
MHTMEIRSIISYIYEETSNLEKLMREEIDDIIRENALRWLSYSISQSILDLFSTLVAELGLRKPPTYAEIAKPLLERGLIDNLLYNDIARIARFRNRIAHTYRKISLKELLEETRWLMRKTPEILNKIIYIIESENIDPAESVIEDLRRILRNIGDEKDFIIAFILFGSRARGDHREDSDLDIAVLSKRSLDEDEIFKLSKEISDKLNFPIDKIDLVDLSRASNELIYKILRDGIPLYVRDYESYRRWVVHEYIRILDEEEGFLETYYRRIKRKISSK